MLYRILLFSVKLEHESAISSVQSLSHVQLFVTPWIAACQVSLSITSSRSLLKLMSIDLVMPSNHLILCRPFSCLQSFPASGSFPVSQFFSSGSQSIGASASASVLPNWGPKGGSLWAQKETGREEQLPTSSPGNSCPKKGKFHLTLLPSCSFQTEPA